MVATAHAASIARRMAPQPQAPAQQTHSRRPFQITIAAITTIDAAIAVV